MHLHTSTLLAIALGVSLSSSFVRSQVTLTLDFGTISLLPNTENQRFVVNASVNQEVTLDVGSFYFFLETGGFNPGQPIITSVDMITGTPWASSGSAGIILNQDQAYGLDMDFDGVTVDPSTGFKLAEIVFSTQGMGSTGTWNLYLDGRVQDPINPSLEIGVLSEAYDYPYANTISVNLASPTVVTLSAVPEPEETAFMAAAGLGLFAGWRSWRRKVSARG